MYTNYKKGDKVKFTSTFGTDDYGIVTRVQGMGKATEVWAFWERSQMEQHCGLESLSLVKAKPKRIKNLPEWW